MAQFIDFFLLPFRAFFSFLFSLDILLTAFNMRDASWFCSLCLVPIIDERTDQETDITLYAPVAANRALCHVSLKLS
jgi:hypothetical protein